MTPHEKLDADERAGIVRFIVVSERDCDRCLTWLHVGDPAAEVQPGSETPWASYTVLCRACGDRMAEKYGQGAR